MMILLAVVAVALIVWVVSSYNFFVSSKARIKASVQEIGNQLKRQADLLPNLTSSAKGYLKHEKGIFKDLTDARKAVNSAIKSKDVQKMADAGSQLASMIPNIQIVVEDNPELKGSEVVSKLMNELRDTSDKIMYARRLVIDLTADFNVKRVKVPTNIVANIFKFGELPGLITPESGEHTKVSQADTKTPKVKL